jgi:pyrroline-5-carboxylate reductase
LLLVGGGKMGEALLSGLLNGSEGGLEAGGEGAERTLVVIEQDADRRTDLTERYDGRDDVQVVESLDALTPSATAEDGAVIAVKPTDCETACRALAQTGIARVLSIAAGVTLDTLEGWLPGKAVLRAMPNTPALVGAGASALAKGQQAGTDDALWARGILEAVGMVVELPEKALDAVTGLSGSGPAYVFLLAEALIDAGVLVGLSRSVAKQLAVQTLLGSARLLAETGDEPSALRAAVTSPGGTTAAGLRALESAGFRNAVLDAVAAAAHRAHELGHPS